MSLTEEAMSSSEEIIENAGKEPGLEIWRIEDMELAVVPKNTYGTFYSGDAYLILNTMETKTGKIEYDLHFWLGKDCSQDESGAAALWTVQMDDGVANGAAVQHRECQNYESKTFNGYFKKLIYQDGGHASGFNHVIPNDFSEIQRMLWVRGKNPVRCTQVAMSWDSLNLSDCFILDLGNDIYVWCGPNSNPWERMKANDMGRSIRDDERAGKAEVHLIDAGEVRCPEKLCPFLGDDIPDELPEEAPEAPPKTSGQKPSGEGRLFKISDEDGEIGYELVSDEPPYSMSMLEDDAVFILGSPAGPAGYIWKGKDSSSDERKKAMEYADKYIEQNDLPKHTQIESMAQFGETAMFKQFFSDWRDIDATDGLGETNTVGSVAKVEHEDFDASTMHDNPQTAAEFGMPDDGSGDKKIFKIVDSEREEVEEENYGIFNSSDCYIISYTYETPKGRPESYIYYWLGNNAGTAIETAAAFQVVQLDGEEFNGDATQVRVEEGKEPNHLIAMFGGGMAIVTSMEARNALFHIRLNRANQIKAYEIECKASNLNSNDTFLLVKEGGSDFGFDEASIAWVGKGGDAKEMEALQKLAEKIGATEIETIEEGSESDEFWELLGGQDEYFTLPRTNNKPRPPRAFECSNATGNFVPEEICGIIHQNDLEPSNVFILDTWDNVFIWLGNESSNSEQEAVQDLAKEYLASSPSKRKGTPIITVHQGKEPITFTGFFLGWDDEFWDTDVSDKLQYS